MSLGKTRRAAAFTLAISALALLGIAQSAMAATVTVDQPCYVLTDKYAAFYDINYSISGVKPNEYVKVGLDPERPQADAPKVDANGNFSGSVSNFFDASGVAPQLSTLQVKNIFTDEVYAETPVAAVQFGMTTSNAHTSDGEKVTFNFGGLASGQPVYAHYVARGKEVFSHKLGVTSAPCGTLSAKSELFPPKHSHFNSYLLQFDQRKKYSPKTKPSFKHGLEVGKF